MKRTILALAAATTFLSGAAFAQDSSNRNINPVPGSSAGETSVIPPTGGTAGAGTTSATSPAEQTATPVPGTEQGRETAMPAGAASTVVTGQNAPAVGSPTQETATPVPGTSNSDDAIIAPSTPAR